MSETIRIGIAGYGNLGRGVEAAVAQNPDLSLVGVFTRRDPAQVRPVRPETTVLAWDSLDQHTGDIDVLILCGGSKDDLPVQGPELAGLFNTVDSYDTHARIPDYFAAVDDRARVAGTTALISTGWDPGLFSLNRMLGEAILPEGHTYTFWGRGLSQGHSDAVRRVPGVAAGVQYTLPSEQAVAAVRRGENPDLPTRDKHTRECYVVLADGADADQVREAIVTMPHYFEPYETTVHFITADELARDHAAMPHGGFVLRSGVTGAGDRQLIEFGLTLGDNPGFTASVLAAYARATHRLAAAGRTGALTLYDVPPGLLSPRSAAELRGDLL
ncbi:MAG TPA: diaminopimelate dehydrogenase [Candidatus Ruania gallistercoris]|uniref:Meso-diaminopimelate D-dehydrogenase n=1 Tax=Candidatus Ruania gallistercoris TaxID=2838746 RepID=A0A9D2EGL9_9MICO|nr:diaminopimelate dehydrogenase [Candidatus Ruania gallistercoris]